MTIASYVALMLCVLPVFFVFPFFFIGYPILLFENASFSEALSKSFNIAKENYGALLGTSLLSLLISIAGVILCGVGIYLTLPFFVVASYSAYCAYFGTPRQLTS